MSREIFLKQIGKLIKSSRAERFTQEDLAKRIGVSRKTLSALENGKPVVTTVLIDALAFLGLLTELQFTVDNLASKVDLDRQRAKSYRELENDF